MASWFYIQLTIREGADGWAHFVHDRKIQVQHPVLPGMYFALDNITPEMYGTKLRVEEVTVVPDECEALDSDVYFLEGKNDREVVALTLEELDLTTQPKRTQISRDFEELTAAMQMHGWTLKSTHGVWDAVANRSELGSAPESTSS